MKISARNVLESKVKNITPGAVNSEVILELPNGVEIASIITKNSVSNLGLRVGEKAFAVIKASSVMFAKGDLEISARNILKGKIISITDGEVNAEVCLDLGDNHLVTGIVTLNSVKRLGLKVGDEASAVIKASEVMVGVK